MVDPDAAADYSGGEGEPHEAHRSHEQLHPGFRLAMLAPRLRGLRVNRRRALRVMGLVAASVAIVALVSRLLAPTEPLPLPARVGLTGLETEPMSLPQSDLPAPDRSDFPDRARSGKRSRPNRRKSAHRRPVPRKPPKSLHEHSTSPSVWAPAVSVSQPPESDRPAQFGFER